MARAVSRVSNVQRRILLSNVVQDLWLACLSWSGEYVEENEQTGETRRITIELENNLALT